MVAQLKAFIVENGITGGEGLSVILKKYFPEIDVLGLADNVEAALGRIAKLKPDIIFLDIELKKGCGFQIIENLSAKSKYFFIITSHVEKYALKAISYGVTDYLLKPFQLEDIVLALNKVKKKTEARSNKVDDIEIVALPSGNKVELIKKEDIIYLKAEGRYTRFFLKGDINLIACRNIGEYEKLLDPKMFFRIHNSFMVNITQAKNINKAAGNYLELKAANCALLPIAKRKYDLLKKFLNIK